MRFFTIILLFVLLLPVIAHAEDELKICQEGIDKCTPLQNDDEKYSKCMRLMCYDYYSDAAKKNNNDAAYKFHFVGLQENKTKKKPNEMVKTCEYGLRKCDALSNTPLYYWECMADSCNHPSDARPDCPLGQNTCIDRQKIYNDCMRLQCGDPAATPRSCPEGAMACGEDLRAYWHCVYGVCLGPVDSYKHPPTSNKFMVVVDNKGVKRRVQVNKLEPVATGAPLWLAVAPPGVDGNEWVRETPQKFMLIGNPAQYMQCPIPTAILDCRLNDIRSCRCSDGSTPIMLNGAPKPQWSDY